MVGNIQQLFLEATFSHGDGEVQMEHFQMMVSPLEGSWDLVMTLIILNLVEFILIAIFKHCKYHAALTIQQQF